MIPPDDVFEGSYLVRLRPALRRIDRVAFPTLGDVPQIWALEICHVGPKLDAWPNVPKAEPIEAWMR